MLKRHEVEILLKAGHAQTEVARLAGVSLCSVKRIAEEAPMANGLEIGYLPQPTLLYSPPFFSSGSPPSMWERHWTGQFAGSASLRARAGVGLSAKY
jgi:hypothetical protein